ncbi:uncharacterized protein LOC135936297 [Cloeon dipterum]|uniref:uncharacterized protein LOC135936297 n=1 Tax=Cloeon dipterum TaxID=197152 RepID=UPI00321F83AB
MLLKIVDGQIVTQELIKSAQDLSLSSDMDTYNKNVAAASICGNQVGMDECDTASLAFSCVQDESPDIVQRAILNVETSNAVEFAALPSAQALCYDSSLGKFQFNVKCRMAYVNEDPNPCGKRAFYNVCGGRNYILTNFYPTKNIDYASGACVEWGLKLASFETYEEFMCVAELFAMSNQTVYAWTSGSFWIVSDKPVWCGSNAPLETSKYPWNLNGTGELAGTPFSTDFFVQLVIPANNPKASFLKTVTNSLQPGGSICEN